MVREKLAVLALVGQVRRGGAGALHWRKVLAGDPYR